MKRLAASRTRSVIQNRLDRSGFGAGGTGVLGAGGGGGVRFGPGPCGAAIPHGPYAAQIAASTTVGISWEYLVAHACSRCWFLQEIMR